MCFLRLILLMCFSFGMVCDVRAAISVAEKNTKMWETISAIEETEAKKLEQVDTNVEYCEFRYWQNVQKQMQNEFDSVFNELKTEEELYLFAECYADYFFSKSAKENMYWVLTCPRFTVDLWGYEMDEKCEQFGCFFQKKIIENCLVDADYYERLCRFTLWANTWSVSNNNVTMTYHITRGQIESEDTQSITYWDSARRFLLIAYLCRWEHHFEDFKAPITKEYLLEKLQKFNLYHWLHATCWWYYDAQNMRYVNAGEAQLPPIEIPQTPFQRDVKINPPVPQEYLRGMDMYPQCLHLSPCEESEDEEE